MSVINSYTVGKFKNHATGQKGYAPLFNGKPMLAKTFKRRAEAEKFVSELRAALLARRADAQANTADA